MIDIAVCANAWGTSTPTTRSPPTDAAIALELAASGGWDANAGVNRDTMKTYGNCIGADGLCARVSHPLGYYRIRKRGGMEHISSKNRS